jgi:hypothetical protein
MATPPGDELILPKSEFRGIVGPTRGDASKYLEFRKNNCLFGKSFAII